MEGKECEKFLFGCEALTSKNDFFIFRIPFLRAFKVRCSLSVEELPLLVLQALRRHSIELTQMQVRDYLEERA